SASATCRTSSVPSTAPPAPRRAASGARRAAIARSSKIGSPPGLRNTAREVLMYDHIGLRVKNLGASVRFYQAALAPLGHVPGTRDESSASFGPPGAPALYIYSDGGQAVAGAHVAFARAERTAVDRFHAAGLEHGGKDNGKPGLRKDYSPKYYAAFLFDPDG